MTDYIDLGLTTNVATLYADGVEAIQVQQPAWRPSPIESWLLSAVARMASEVAVLAGQVPLEIFTYFGQSVLKIQALTATAATGTARFTLADTAGGYTITAGTQLDVGGVAFETIEDVTATVGASTLDAAIVAIDTGSASGGLSGAATLISPTYIFVDTVALVGTTTAATDGETGEEYANRLADELPELSPKVVLVPDAEARARRNPAVARALAINRYNPGPPADPDAEGHISVFVHATGGTTVGSTAKTAIATDMEANRINGLVVHVLDPAYTRVDVRFTGRCYPDFDPATVQAAAVQAVLDFLNPSNWGRGDDKDQTNWDDEPTLYRNDLIGVVLSVDGMRHLDTLTLAIYGNAQGTLDLTLNGPASLPATDSVATGTVTV